MIFESHQPAIPKLCILKITKMSTASRLRTLFNIINWKCGPMPNMMVALPNIGGALYSTLQSLADATTTCRAVTMPRRKTSRKLVGCPKL